MLDAAGDTLAFVETEPVKDTIFTYLADGRSIPGRIYYNGRPSAGYHPDRGLVMGLGNQGVVKEYDLEGNLKKIVRLDVPADPLTEADRRRVLDGLQRSLDIYSNQNQRRIAEEQLKRVEFQDPKAFWLVIQLDSHGYTWAIKPEYLVPHSQEVMPPVFRIFSPEGVYLGDTEAPINANIHGRYLVARLVSESTGEEDYVVYRPVPLPVGFVYP